MRELALMEGATFGQARAVADAVFFDGYSLCPPGQAAGNRRDSQAGVVAPRGFRDLERSERWWLETQCLLQPRDAARAGVTIEGRLRFLQPGRRQVEQLSGAVFRPVEALAACARTFQSWDEAAVREVEFRHGITWEDPARGTERAVVFEAPGTATSELIRDEDERVVGRERHQRFELRGVLRVGLAPVAAARPLCRLRVRIENVTPWADHDDVLRSSFVGAHLLLGVSGGTFVSLLDPPAWARPGAAACHNRGLYPVLAGEPPRGDVILAAPINLSDHPGAGSSGACA